MMWSILSRVTAESVANLRDHNLVSKWSAMKLPLANTSTDSPVSMSKPWQDSPLLDACKLATVSTKLYPLFSAKVRGKNSRAFPNSLTAYWSRPFSSDANFCKCLDARISKQPAPGRNLEPLHMLRYTSMALLTARSRSSMKDAVDPRSTIVAMSPSFSAVSIRITLFSPMLVD